MKKALYLLAVCSLIGFSSYAQPKIGVGFRLGDLSGISFKSNFGDNAMELSVGRLLRFGHPSYEDWFYHYKAYNEDTYVYKYSSLHYPLAVQLHYLRHRTISFADPLRWYYGLGAQVRMFPVDYTYSDNTGVYTVRRKFWEAGVDWVIGLEYNFPDVPIGVFMDALLLMEVYDTPFFPWGQFGIGARYNF
ncbi:MAG: hypothetical protein H6585_05080 [Flavobacteriales bacterium]|nr:hypothetical protein [Flavobacteriales bacterium]MCB9447701.1 hypothetical protein [Flavobacteriales bacterium]